MWTLSFVCSPFFLHFIFHFLQHSILELASVLWSQPMIWQLNFCGTLSLCCINSWRHLLAITTALSCSLCNHLLRFFLFLFLCHFFSSSAIALVKQGTEQSGRFIADTWPIFIYISYCTIPVKLLHLDLFLTPAFFLDHFKDLFDA